MNRLAEEQAYTEQEKEQKVVQQLPARVRSAYFRDKEQQAHKFADAMAEDNRRHAEAFEDLKRNRSAEIAKQAEKELQAKLVYNNKVKESKSKIVTYAD